MKLAPFFDAIGPFLDGGRTHEETRRALFGDGGGPDAERLAIYGRFCRVHRFESLEGVYVYVREEVVRRAGESVWDALVDDYFRAHPMRHVELCENGDAFAEFLASESEARGLPDWLAPLAELEWWEWKTRTAPDDDSECSDESGDGGPLAIASTVELRPFAFDLVSWIDGPRDDEPGSEPARSDVLVLFFRDRDLDARRELATTAELCVLKAVSEGAHAVPGMPQPLFDEVARSLWESGVLRGARPDGPAPAR